MSSSLSTLKLTSNSSRLLNVALPFESNLNEIGFTKHIQNAHVVDMITNIRIMFFNVKNQEQT